MNFEGPKRKFCKTMGKLMAKAILTKFSSPQWTKSEEVNFCGTR